MRRRRWSAGAAVAAVVVGTFSALAAPASAALSSAGPIDPASQFPSYYADANGLQLQLCQDGLPNCLAGPEQIQDVRAAGGDAEAFYFHASADLAGFTIETALEAAYAAAGDGQETTFQRRQAVAKGVTPGGKYTITDLYGSWPCQGVRHVPQRNQCRSGELQRGARRAQRGHRSVPDLGHLR